MKNINTISMHGEKKTGELIHNFIAPITITEYNDRGLGPFLCSLFTIRIMFII